MDLLLALESDVDPQGDILTRISICDCRVLKFQGSTLSILDTGHICMSNLSHTFDDKCCCRGNHS